MPLFSSGEQGKEHTSTPQETANTDSRDQPTARKLPPHMQRIIDERSAPRLRPDASVEEQRNAYERRRMALQFDIDQGELASSPENPWSHRIQLLTEALADVENELREAEQVVPGPWHPLPATPIRDIDAEKNEAVRLRFSIDGETFEFEELLDWAERGTQVARPELVQTGGDAAKLVPEDTPNDLVEPLQRHLQDSVVTFATDMRDHVLDNDPLPQDATLADLAKPCPTCGGWTDWKGACDTCAARKGRAHQLFQERNHLMKERSAEAEERHRLAERLALARHRMRDLENEIAQWEASLKK